MGILWLGAGILLLATAGTFMMDLDYWWMMGVAGALLSQILIFTAWQDARFGTFGNLIVLVTAILAACTIFFENNFEHDVSEGLRRTGEISTSLVTEADLESLPVPIRRYLTYAEVVNKPKVVSMRIVFEGDMREKGKQWFPFRSVQYNFFDEPTRLFFMKGTMFGLTVPGYHRYENATATMDIRLFGLFPVVRESGAIMDKTETVTLFNDMCLMAPATLIDKRIRWETMDASSARAIFTNHGISIKAVLTINEEGQLVNFESGDRTAISDMKQYTFLTPVSNYHIVDGIRIWTYGEAVWRYPEGDFTYGKFRLKEIQYNMK